MIVLMVKMMVKIMVIMKIMVMVNIEDDDDSGDHEVGDDDDCNHGDQNSSLVVCVLGSLSCLMQRHGFDPPRGEFFRERGFFS